MASESSPARPSAAPPPWWIVTRGPGSAAAFSTLCVALDLYLLYAILTEYTTPRLVAFIGFFVVAIAFLVSLVYYSRQLAGTPPKKLKAR